MVFSSVSFLFYFLPAFLLFYFFCPPRFKNYAILFFSILFYAWGGPLFIFVILGTTTLDYILVKGIEKSKTTRAKKGFLILSLFVNLGLLFSFKYLNFFADNLDILLAKFGMTPFKIDKIALPIGISFFTFESLTYVIDVYRGQSRSLNNYGNYLTYILMFPKLIAGPIVSYHVIGPQIESLRTENAAEMRVSGILRFIGGLAKKILIANLLAETVEQIYALPAEQVGTGMAWAAAVGYSMQLYFDFSGYSDMAIGLGKMMGFRIPENFNFPYISSSITEFWKRWHISLGNWMRSYLYIPLGGNQSGKFRTLLNLMIVFVVSGFWHGAGWNFLLWGICHGFFILIEKWFLSKYLKNIIGVIYTFLVVNLAWIFFRNDDISVSLTMIKKMFVFETPPFIFQSMVFNAGSRFYIVLTIALLFSFSGLLKPVQNAFQNEEKLFLSGNLRLFASYSVGIILLIMSAAYLMGQDFNPFIYFRF